MEFQLKKEVAEPWLKDLRSGEYAQTQGWLVKHSDGFSKPSFCCMGVLCRTIGYSNNEIGLVGAIGINTFINRIEDRYPDLNDSRLIDRFPQQLENKLMKLNDSLHYNFEQIADWVEENVEFV